MVAGGAGCAEGVGVVVAVVGVVGVVEVVGFVGVVGVVGVRGVLGVVGVTGVVGFEVGVAGAAPGALGVGGGTEVDGGTGVTVASGGTSVVIPVGTSCTKMLDSPEGSMSEVRFAAVDSKATRRPSRERDGRWLSPFVGTPGVIDSLARTSAPVSASRTKTFDWPANAEAGAPSGARFVPRDWNATTRPSPLMDGSALSAFGGDPLAGSDTDRSWPFSWFQRSTDEKPPSRGRDSKATNWPSPEIEGSISSPGLELGAVRVLADETSRTRTEWDVDARAPRLSAAD
jgi:hypothetical protein